MVAEKRLIDANEAYEIARDSGCHNDFARSMADLASLREVLEECTTVDAVEVVPGRWEPHYETFDADIAVGILGGDYQTGWQCSVCGRYEPSKEPYCNCGAKMDGDGNG